jgi:hypothetical protein
MQVERMKLASIAVASYPAIWEKITEPSFMDCLKYPLLWAIAVAYSGLHLADCDAFSQQGLSIRSGSAARHFVWIRCGLLLRISNPDGLPYP